MTIHKIITFHENITYNTPINYFEMTDEEKQKYMQKTCVNGYAVGKQKVRSPPSLNSVLRVQLVYEPQKNTRRW